MLIDKKTGEIFVYGTIGADYEGGGISAESVIEALDQMGGKRVTVRINSPGGNAFDGIAIYNQLRRYPGGVDTINDSLAASAASIIALAGDTRTTAKGAMWMVHSASTVAYGNVQDLRKALAMLETGDKALASIYEERTKLKASQIEEAMTKETWYTAEESVKFGFATKVEGQASRPAAVAASTSTDTLRRYQEQQRAEDADRKRRYQELIRGRS